MSEVTKTDPYSVSPLRSGLLPYVQLHTVKKKCNYIVYPQAWSILHYLSTMEAINKMSSIY